MADTVINAVIQLRRGTEAQWVAVADSFIPNPGEPCLTIDGDNKGQIKYGDGISTWGQLEYSTQNLNETVNSLVSAIGTKNESSSITANDIWSALEEIIQDYTNADNNINQNVSVISQNLANNYYTKTQTDNQIEDKISQAIVTVYKPAGSMLFENLPEPSSSLVGNVYDITNDFIANDNFVPTEVGQSYSSGTNVVCIEYESDNYKYDTLSTSLNLSEYSTTEEVQNMIQISQEQASEQLKEELIGTGDATSTTIKGAVLESKNYTDEKIQSFTPNLTSNNQSISITKEQSNVDLSVNCDNSTIGMVNGKLSSLVSIPKGGTSGQVLLKKSDSDFDCTWGDISETGYLVNQVVILSVENWQENDSKVTQTVDVAGITSETPTIVSPLYEYRDLVGQYGVCCSDQQTGTLTFTADSIPSGEIQYNIGIFNGSGSSASNLANDLQFDNSTVNLSQNVSNNFPVIQGENIDVLDIPYFSPADVEGMREITNFNLNYFQFYKENGRNKVKADFSFTISEENTGAGFCLGIEGVIGQNYNEYYEDKIFQFLTPINTETLSGQTIYPVYYLPPGSIVKTDSQETYSYESASMFLMNSVGCLVLILSLENGELATFPLGNFTVQFDIYVNNNFDVNKEFFVWDRMGGFYNNGLFYPNAEDKKVHFKLEASVKNSYFKTGVIVSSDLIQQYFDLNTEYVNENILINGNSGYPLTFEYIDENFQNNYLLSFQNTSGLSGTITLSIDIPVAKNYNYYSQEEITTLENAIQSLNTNKASVSLLENLITNNAKDIYFDNSLAQLPQVEEKNFPREGEEVDLSLQGTVFLSDSNFNQTPLTNNPSIKLYQQDYVSFCSFDITISLSENKPLIFTIPQPLIEFLQDTPITQVNNIIDFIVYTMSYPLKLGDAGTADYYITLPSGSIMKDGVDLGECYLGILSYNNIPTFFISTDKSFSFQNQVQAGEYVLKFNVPTGMIGSFIVSGILTDENTQNSFNLKVYPDWDANSLYFQTNLSSNSVDSNNRIVFKNYSISTTSYFDIQEETQSTNYEAYKQDNNIIINGQTGFSYLFTGGDDYDFNFYIAKISNQQFVELGVSAPYDIQINMPIQKTVSLWKLKDVTNVEQAIRSIKKLIDNLSSSSTT